MIEMYTGTPGSGKSLHCANKIMNWLHRWKSPVIGNFPFRSLACRPKGWGSYLFVPNDKLDPDLLVSFSEQYRAKRKWERVPEEHILLVIDECQLIFNSRDWHRADRAGWLSFFTQHRKLGYRIILVCQFDMMVDKQIRALVEYEYIHRKIKNVGKMGSLLNFIAFGNLHVDIKVYKPLEQKVESHFYKADPRVCALYDSYARLDA